jgi:hypothetical protein
LVRAIVACHGIVKEKNGARRQMFLFFPAWLVGADDKMPRAPHVIAAFS